MGQPLMAQKKYFYRKFPLTGPPKKIIILQVMQFISIILKNFRNLERTNPRGFKFTMFSFLLFGFIPLENEISQLEILFS
jgi:hypothetical protein